MHLHPDAEAAGARLIAFDTLGSTNAEALSRATGRTVDLKVVVDPSVIGGVVARVGDEVFDGSIASRLEDAKQALGSV